MLGLPIASELGENKDRRTYSDNLRGCCGGLGGETQVGADEGLVAGFDPVRDEATFPGILKFTLLELEALTVGF